MPKVCFGKVRYCQGQFAILISKEVISTGILQMTTSVDVSFIERSEGTRSQMPTGCPGILTTVYTAGKHFPTTICASKLCSP